MESVRRYFWCSSGSCSGVGMPGVQKIFIDSGHWGNDSGALRNGLKEKDIVLSIAQKLTGLFNAKGFQISHSRYSDTSVELAERAEMANSWGADLFISIHANALDGSGSAYGTECYTYPNSTAENKRLSVDIASSISNKIGAYNRGHKEADFAVLRLTKMPAVLIETAIKKLINIRTSSDSVKVITWLIDSGSYSEEDINNFKHSASVFGSNIQFVKSKAEFINYINTGNISGVGKRIYPISKFTLFGHGEVGKLLFGSNYNIEIADFNQINSSAFQNTHSIFYSCNTATDGNNSFAYAWNLKTNGVTEAVVYRTEYDFISLNENASIVERAAVKALRTQTGYIPAGSSNYPIPAKEDNAYWVTF